MTAQPAANERVPDPVEQQTFESRDVGRIEAFLSDNYSAMRIRTVGEHTYARITRRPLNRFLSFDDVEYGVDISYQAEPPDRMLIVDVVDNSIRRDDEYGEEIFGPGDLFLAGDPNQPFNGVARSSRVRVTALDPAVLHRVASGADRVPGERVRVLDHRPVSREAALHLRRAIAHVRDSLLASSELARDDLLSSAATDYLAAAVLRAFPNTAVAAATATERRDAKPSTIRRAISYIESNADLDLTLTDIAKAAFVTPRAVQLAFRRSVGTTPLGYLRRVRLDRARADLLAATTGEGTTVTDIAARWGFTGSRFSQLYRTTYGERPSDTLRT